MKQILLLYRKAIFNLANKKIQEFRVKRFFFLISFLLISFNASSATIWSGNTSIIYVYPTETGFAFVVDYSNPISTCDNGRRFQFKADAPKHDVMVSTFLAAFMAGKQVNLAIDDTQVPTCSPKVNRFRVYQ